MKEIIKKKSPIFISRATAAKFVLPIPIYLAYLVRVDVDGQETLLQTCVQFGVNLTFFAPWLPRQ
jgi:hypothetical protein